GELGGHSLDVTDTHARVEQHGLPRAEDEIGDHLFGLMRLVDGEHVGRDPVHLKPGVAHADALERLVLGAWQRAAPRWLSRGRRPWCGERMAGRIGQDERQGKDPAHVPKPACHACPRRWWCSVTNRCGLYPVECAAGTAPRVSV